MLEAVNSVLSNAAALQSATSNARAELSEPVKRSDIIKVRTDPYISRFVQLQNAQNRVIVQTRDTSTGATVNQFPTEQQIKAYQRSQQVSDSPVLQQAREEQFASSVPTSGTGSSNVSVDITIGSSEASAPVNAPKNAGSFSIEA